MTEKKAKTATPHLRETPEQQQQVEHEDAIEYAGKGGKRVGAGFEKRMGSSEFGRSGPRYARALCSSQLRRHVLSDAAASSTGRDSQN
jgi:hypothetical protein